MRRYLPLLSFLILALAVPALGDDASAEDRFHEAYVLEVVDGKVKEAAKAYLELGEDATASAEVRAEARFRFAVCAVLLGRPDEARIQLADLIRGTSTPAATRTRAEEYLRAMTDLGVGTELEKKLRTLVFELGRVGPDERPIPVYRDFEIIGEPAIPLLLELSRHSDAKIRKHAFRLLCRLGAEGMVELWTPELGLAGPLGDDLDRYLKSRPSQFRLLERKLLALDDEALLPVLRGGSPDSAFMSMDFVRAIFAREPVRPWGVTYLHGAGEEPDRWAFARDALLGDDAAASKAAAMWVLEQHTAVPEELAEPLWPRFLERLTEFGQAWSPVGAHRGPTSRRLVAYVSRLPGEVLLESLGRLVEVGEAVPSDGKPNPLTNGLADVIAYVYEQGGTEKIDFPRYEALLRRWVAAIPDLTKEVARRPVSGLLRHLEFVLDNAPLPQGDALLAWLLEGPARERVSEFAPVVNVRGPNDVRRILAAMPLVIPYERDDLVKRIPHVVLQDASLELRVAIAEAAPDLLRFTDADAMKRTAFGFPWILRGVSRDEQIRYLEALLRAAQEGGEKTLTQVLRYVHAMEWTKDWETVREGMRFTIDIGLPAFDTLWADWPEPARRGVFDILSRFVLKGAWRGKRGLDVMEPADRERLAAFVRARLRQVPAQQWSLVKRVLPLEEWLLHAPSSVRRSLSVSRAEADRVIAARLPVGQVPRKALLVFAARHASPEVKRELFDRALTSSSAEARHNALFATRPLNTRAPASVEAFERALELTLAEKSVRLDVVDALARILVRKRPTENLFGAVRALLANAKYAHSGIELAASLGQEELVEDLVPFLDSMDVQLRTAAHRAVGAIRQVSRVKKDTEQVSD